jgi:hypothetical protein
LSIIRFNISLRTSLSTCSVNALKATDFIYASGFSASDVLPFAWISDLLKPSPLWYISWFLTCDI